MLKLRPDCIHFILFLPQTETLSSLKALLKHIDQSQLTRDLEGTFHYNHSHWIHFRQVGEMEVPGLANIITT